MSLSKNIIKYQDVYLTIIFGVMIAMGLLHRLKVLLSLVLISGSTSWLLVFLCFQFACFAQSGLGSYV